MLDIEREGFRLDIESEDWSAWAYTRPCPACFGTGRKLATVPRLLLDATMDAAARTELLVYADRLQADGDERGLLIAHALAGQPHPGADAWLDRLAEVQR
jgi:hypothetical protein